MQSLDTLFVGQVSHTLPQVASTNEYALSLLSKSKPPEGTVISTPCQYDGRGQIGSKWESEPGKNITLSVILYPDFLPIHLQFQLNIAVSLAVHDVVANHLSHVKVKWPNDIYVREKKIAGILIQNIVSNSRLKASVAGIGLNVNQTVFITHPPNPTSFKLETGNTFNLQELTAELCRSMEARYLKLKAGKMVPLLEDYLHCLFRFQEPAIFERADGKVFDGTITGITESGRLKILSARKEEEFDLKEIKFHGI